MEWKKTHRETGLIEHICGHGIGHPNTASAIRMHDVWGEGSSVDSWLIHGCDGCCASEDFPGHPFYVALHTANIYVGHPTAMEDLKKNFPALQQALQEFSQASTGSNLQRLTTVAKSIIEDSNAVETLRKYPFLYYSMLALAAL